MSLAEAKVTGMDAAVAAVLMELEDISTVKQWQRAALEAFLGGQHFLASLPTGFVKSLVKEDSTKWKPQAADA